MTSQLNLFSDTNSDQKPTAIDVQYIKLSDLIPHPMNIRPWSDKYKMNVEDDHVETLKQTIQSSGFSVVNALKVRPLDNGYQVISGHHRLAAATELEFETLPCVVYQVDDMTALVMLYQDNHNREMTTWNRAKFASEVIVKYGKGDELTVSEFAKRFGLRHNTVSEGLTAYKVAQKLMEKCRDRDTFNPENPPLSMYSLRLIGQGLPEEDWEWFSELCIDKDWTSDQLVASIKAVKRINELFSGKGEKHKFWLNPDTYKKKAANEAVLKEGELICRTITDVERWINTADGCWMSLAAIDKVWVFGDGIPEPYQEDYPAQDYFIKSLVELSLNSKVPSADKITSKFKKLFDYVADRNNRYNLWLAAKESEEEKQKQELARKILWAKMEEHYSPKGYLGDIRTLELPSDYYDAIITDPPYLLSNNGTTVRSGKEVSVNKNFEDDSETAITPKEWLKIAFDVLKPGGNLVITCTTHILFDVYQQAVELGFTFKQKLAWCKTNPPPRLTTDGFTDAIEDILVFNKPGTAPYFGYDDIQLNNKQRPNFIEIPTCAGNERLGWHDTQKPLELAELLTLAYVPYSGTVLDLFAGTATFTVAAKKLGRCGHWIEKNPEFFEQAQSRIETTDFPANLFDEWEKTIHILEN